jgi:hypothetical protein
MERGTIQVILHLGVESMKFASLHGKKLVLASNERVAIRGERLVLPPDSLAVLADEAVEAE